MDGSAALIVLPALTTAFAFASGNFGSESVQALAPETAELVEPAIHLLQRRGVHGIDTARPVRTNSREAIVAQNLQVLRHGCLGDAEFSLDHFDNSAGGVFTGREKFKNATPDGITENVKGMHGDFADA